VKVQIEVKMKPEERRQETDEEFLARLAARRAKRLEDAKPKLTLNVSPRIAEAVKADPDSVKVAVKSTDETVVVERARPREIIEVLEVDGMGRPKLVRRVDCATGDVGLFEMAGGYRPQNVAWHEYNALDGLRRPGDE
jgi:hypothetical protein